MAPWNRRFLLETITFRFQPLNLGSVAISSLRNRAWTPGKKWRSHELYLDLSSVFKICACSPQKTTKRQTFFRFYISRRFRYEIAVMLRYSFWGWSLQILGTMVPLTYEHFLSHFCTWTLKPTSSAKPWQKHERWKVASFFAMIFLAPNKKGHGGGYFSRTFFQRGEIFHP